MATSVTLYKVFIASPSDVADERKRFKNVIMSFNERYAIKHDAIFTPVYWEQNTAGLISPQVKANKRLDECDYALIVFGKKWGTPPNHNNPADYSSGTREEFERAVDNYNDPENDMKDVVVLIKELSSESKSDPGYHAKQIINFKKILYDRGFSYLPFENIDDFSSILANHLNEWLDNHINGGNKIERHIIAEHDYFRNKHIDHIQFPGEEPLDKKSELYKVLNKAAQLADGCKIIEAQEIYNELIEKDRSLSALNDYAKLLYRIGELSNSENLFMEVLEIARLKDSYGWMARATANLAIICMNRSEFDRAIRYLQDSLGYNQKLEHHVGIADNYRHLANVFRFQCDLDLAEEHLVKALSIFEKRKVYAGLADAHADYGVIQRIRGKYNSSIAHYNEALNINLNHTPEKESCRADYIDRLGTIHRIRGNLKQAKKLYSEALAINTKLSRQSGMAEALGHLGVIELYFGCFNEAETKLDYALSIDRELNNKVGMAKHLASKARVFLWKGELERAQDLSRQSRDISKQIKSLEGIAYSTYMIANVQYATKEITRAEKNVEEALLLWQKIKGAEGIAECQELKALVLHVKRIDKAALELIDNALEYCEKSGSRIMQSSLLIARANIKGTIGIDGQNEDLKKAFLITKDTNEYLKMNMLQKHFGEKIEEYKCRLESINELIGNINTHREEFLSIISSDNKKMALFILEEINKQIAPDSPDEAKLDKLLSSLKSIVEEVADNTLANGWLNILNGLL